MLTETIIPSLNHFHPMLNIPLDPQGDEWLTQAELIQQLPPLIRTIEDEFGLLDRRAAGSLFWGHYNWFVVTSGLASFLAYQQLPNFAPDNVLFRLAEDGCVSQMGLRNGRSFTHPNPDILRNWFHDQLKAHMKPLVIAIKQTTKLSNLVMWGLLADRCVGVLIRLLRQLDRLDELDEQVDKLLAQPFSEFPIRSTVRHVGTDYYFLQRSVCCLSYKIQGEINCVTCPQIHPTEQAERLKKLISQNKTVTFEPSSRNGEASAPLF